MKRLHLEFCLVLCVAKIIHATYPPSASSKYPNPEFVPAMPGETPKCVKDARLTFCLEPEKYPKDRIVYLVENKMYDTDTFLQDETRDTYTFEAREMRLPPKVVMTYGPSSRTYGNSSPSYNRTNGGYPSSKPSKYGGGASHYHSNNIYSNFSNSHNYNSFSNHHYPTKHSPQPPQHYYTYPSTSHYKTDAPYPRYTKREGHQVIAHSPPRQQQWWKKILRRSRRQAPANELCPAAANYIMPRAAQNVGGNWMFLVNVDQRYRQQVKSETCTSNQCRGPCNVPQGFTAVCQQQYVQKRLVSLDGGGEKLNSDTFWFPSCCLCKFRPNTS